MSTRELLTNINKEDQGIALAVEAAIPQIIPFIETTVELMKQGGRLFYIGAGTSGRLGILDASECPPTYGVPHDWVIGIIAGGDEAIRSAVENAEDHLDQAWRDLQAYHITPLDTVVGIAASGTTPYVIHGLQTARQNGINTACITCNPGAPITTVCHYPIVAITGPEFVTGSTRMKAGTAQKLILNMISTSIMIQLGRVIDNKMVDMQLSNEKLVNRGTQMLVNELQITEKEAQQLLLEYKGVRKAVEAYRQKNK